MDNLNRVGMEIRLVNESWRHTVYHYAQRKNLHGAALTLFDNLVEAGHEEPWAALEALSKHGCVDLILGQHHVSHANIANAH